VRLSSLPAVLALSGAAVLSACGVTSPDLAPRPDGIQLAFFNPIGDQSLPEDNPLPPASAGTGVTVSSLQNVTHGFVSGWNADRRPVLMGVGPLNVATSFYLSFTITPTTAGLGVFLDSLTYTYASYEIGTTGTISLRTSADGFATTVDSKAWEGNLELVDLVFDASGVPFVTGPLEVRLYMHGLVGGWAGGGPDGFPVPTDWADLVSTAASGDGLRVFGNVHVR